MSSRRETPSTSRMKETKYTRPGRRPKRRTTDFERYVTLAPERPLTSAICLSPSPSGVNENVMLRRTKRRDGARANRVTHRERRGSPRDVHELQLDTVGVGEEDGVVARHVLRVLARRMEDCPTPRRDVARERVHLRAALRPEGHLAAADTVLRERVARIARVRLLDPDAPAGAQPTDDRGALGLPDPGIAETRHE